MPAAPTIDELEIADDPAAWRSIGFHVEGELCEVSSVRIRLVGKGPRRGIVGWALRDHAGGPLAGLPTRLSERSPAAGGTHPNGVVSIDHVVVLSPDLERTTAALEAARFDLRRLREGETPGGSTRQAFFRMGELILEVVDAPQGTSVAADPGGPARLWGISFLVEEMETTAGVLGELVGRPREALQPGRLIATLRPEAGVGPAVAFMTPGPGAA